MKPLQILLANDDPEAMGRLRETLEPKGYDLIFATTDEEAVEQVNRHHPDLVILDGALSGTTHYQMMKRLGGTSSETRPRVFVLTVRGDNHGGLHGYDEGADMYLNDRYHPLELLSFVRKLIGSPDAAGPENSPDTHTGS